MAESAPEGYRELIEQALSEYGEKNFEEASSLFERAHGIYPNARTLRGMGMTAFELRRYDECVLHLEAALASEVKALDGGLREQAEALLSRARAFVARVVVTILPRSGTLRIDGRAITRAGEEALLLGLGEHVIDASAPGYRSEERNVRVRGGETLAVDLTLQREQPPSNNRLLSKPIADRPVRLYKNPWLWSAIGAAVIGAVVVGVVVGTRDRAQASNPNTPVGMLPPPMSASR